MTQTVEKVRLGNDSSQLEFRKYNHLQDLPAQRELFKDAFPEAVGTPQAEEDHYFWKFQSFPDSPPSYEYVAFFEGKMVGYYAALPYRYKLHGIEFKSAMVCDVMTHSAMRGKGVFTKLGAYALDQMSQAGLDISFGYPIRPEVIPGHLKVGWQISGKLPLQLKVLKVDSALKNHSLKFVTPLLNVGAKIYGAIFGATANKNFTINRQSIEEFLADENSPEFVTKVTASQESVLLKDPLFIKWRYGAPKIDYKVITVRDGKQILAAAFVRKAILREIPTTAILDLMVLAERADSLSSLFFEIEKLSGELNTEMVASMMSQNRAKLLGLFKFGFIRSPFVFQLITRGLSEKIKTISQVSVDDFNPLWVDSDDL